MTHFGWLGWLGWVWSQVGYLWQRDGRLKENSSGLPQECRWKFSLAAQPDMRV